MYSTVLGDFDAFTPVQSAARTVPPAIRAVDICTSYSLLDLDLLTPRSHRAVVYWIALRACQTHRNLGRPAFI